MPRPVRYLLALTLGLLTLGAGPAAGAVAVDDPAYTRQLQWGLERIGAADAWTRSTGRGTTIAVVDSGVDLSHEDLVDKLDGSISCIGANGDPGACGGSGQDDNGHGTHVAGIAAASTDNHRGIAGVAPDARLLAVRVLANQCNGSGCTASGTAADVSAGIRWAAAQGADVINLSLGGGTLQSLGSCGFCDAIDEAWDAGSIVVVAAGNDSILPSGFDDMVPAVVVTATDRSDRRASYSSSSSGLLKAARWPVAAPGGEAESDPDGCRPTGQPEGVLSTYWEKGLTDQYACMAGTSMAAPHVSGALALLRSAGLGPTEAIERLTTTADDLGPPGRDGSFGMGRINLARAVASLPRASTSTTVASPTTARPSSTSTAPVVDPGTTAPSAPTPSEPTVVTPDTQVAAPFVPAAAPDPETDGVPTWLIVVACGALLASGAATAATAWHLDRT